MSCFNTVSAHWHKGRINQRTMGAGPVMTSVLGAPELTINCLVLTLWMGAIGEICKLLSSSAEGYSKVDLVLYLWTLHEPNLECPNLLFPSQTKLDC